MSDRAKIEVAIANDIDYGIQYKKGAAWIARAVMAHFLDEGEMSQFKDGYGFECPKCFALHGKSGHCYYCKTVEVVPRHTCGPVGKCPVCMEWGRTCPAKIQIDGIERRCRRQSPDQHADGGHDVIVTDEDGKSGKHVQWSYWRAVQPPRL